MKQLLEVKKQVIAAFLAHEAGEEPLMTDKEYDKLLSKVTSADPTFDIYSYLPVDPDEEEIAHRIDIPEMDKTYIEDTEEFNQEFILTPEQQAADTKKMPKYDGSSLVVYYTNGKLSHIVTRGDGSTGINKTENFRALVPAEIDPEISFLCCECVIDHSLASNARAKANGLVNSKYKQEEIEQLATLICFAAYDLDNEEVDFDHEPIFHDGISFPKFIVSPTNTPEDIEIVEKGFVKLNNYGLTVAIDGIVIREYDSESNEYIKYAYKYDFIDAVETKITGFTIEETSKEGFSHVINVEPVVVDEKTISNIYPGGASVVLEEGYYVGQRIMVAFAGATIPKIVAKIDNLEWDEENEKWLDGPNGEHFTLGVCPICGTEFTPDSIIKGLQRCSNVNCQAKIDMRKELATDFITDYCYHYDDEENLVEAPVDEEGNYVFADELAKDEENCEALFMTLLNISGFNYEKRRNLPANEYFADMINAAKAGNILEVVNNTQINEEDLKATLDQLTTIKEKLALYNHVVTVEDLGTATVLSILEGAFNFTQNHYDELLLKLPATIKCYFEAFDMKIAKVEEEVEEEVNDEQAAFEEMIADDSEEELQAKLAALQKQIEAKKANA